jgi:tetratricopeptide (TPR) repeat protein
MPAALSASEEAQLKQTIEMFEVITQSQPLDYQSLEILKEAYLKLGRQKDVVNTSKRIAQAYVQLGQLSSAIFEYESVLQLFPGDPDVIQALAQIENRAGSISDHPPEAEAPEKKRFDAASPVAAQAHPAPAKNSPPGFHADVDDGRKIMSKLLVDGKHMTEADFSRHWQTPSLNDPPAQVATPFIQILADKGILPLEKSVKIVMEKARLGFLPIDRYEVDVDVARSVPCDICRRWCILPFDRMSKSLLVATANPFNKQAAREVEQAVQTRLLWYMTNPSDLVKTIQKIFR